MSNINEAVSAKKPTFRNFCKEEFSLFSKIKNFSVKSQLKFLNISGQEAKFSIHRLFDYTVAQSKDLDKYYTEKDEEFKKILDTILLIADCPDGIRKARVMPKTEVRGSYDIDTYEYTFTDEKSGYTIFISAELSENRAFPECKATINFIIKGAESKLDSETTFSEFPEFVPGKILVSNWGYSMSLNSFYKIIKRSGKAIYTVKLGNKTIAGDGWSGQEIPNEKVQENDVFKSLLRANSKYVKIDGHTATLWDGKPQYYDRND